MSMPTSTHSPTLPVAIVRLAWQSYLSRLRSDPLITKSLTSAVLSVFSDLLSKRITRSPWKSSAAIHELTAGLILRGPLIHALHVILDRVLFKSRAPGSLKTVAGKVMVDQIIFAPFLTMLYFYLRALAEDRSLLRTTRELRREMGGIMTRSWMVWIPANIVNYGLVPLELRALFGSVVALFWNAFVISRAARKQR